MKVSTHGNKVSCLVFCSKESETKHSPHSGWVMHRARAVDRKFLCVIIIWPGPRYFAARYSVWFKQHLNSNPSHSDNINAVLTKLSQSQTCIHQIETLFYLTNEGLDQGMDGPIRVWLSIRKLVCHHQNLTEEERKSDHKSGLKINLSSNVYFVMTDHSFLDIYTEEKNCELLGFLCWPA